MEVSLWGALLANAGMVKHAAGWLEGGLSFGFEKFITDVEALQTIATLCTRPDSSAAAMGWDALTQVQPGGHFFGADQTIERFEEAFYRPLVADLSNHGQWVEAGGLRADQRATDLWQAILAGFTPPAGADARAARIEDYIATRTKAGGMPILE